MNQRTGKHVPDAASGIPSPGPFSPVLVVPQGNLVVISGQGPVGPDGEVVGETVDAQATYVLEACRDLLVTAGCTFDDVFKVNVYLADLDDWPSFNRVYAAMVPEPRPARTAVGSALLFGMLVEVEMWAVRE